MARNETMKTNRTNENKQTFQGVFGTDTFDHEEASLKFLQRLLYVFMTSVLKYRKILPEEAFTRRVVRDVPDYGNCQVTILKTGHKTAERAARLLASCGEAIKKRYLRTFALTIHEKGAAEPILASEAFVATFAYGKKDIMLLQDKFNNTLAELYYQNPDQVKYETLRLADNIRSICHNLLDLPKDFRPVIRLGYYDERTPEDYQPSGFFATNADVRYPADSINLEVGRIDTMHNMEYFELNSVYIGDTDTFDERCASTYKQIMSDRKKRDTNRSLNSTFMDTSVIDQSLYHETPGKRGDAEYGREAELDEVETARNGVELVSISNNSPKLIHPVQLADTEAQINEETSDEKEKRKKRKSTVARNLFGPSPPKSRKTRSQSKTTPTSVKTRAQSKKQARISESTSKTTISSTGIIEQPPRDRPIYVPSPTRQPVEFEKFSGRDILMDTPEARHKQL